MEQFICPEDSFDANYICSSCNEMLCPKHYFSHQEKFPYHEIDRVLVPVNNESRQILFNFVINIKERVISFINNIDAELWAKHSDNDRDEIWRRNCSIHTLNLLLLYISKIQYIPKAMFYSPFEYFLHQPAEKALKYTTNIKFPKSIEEWNPEYLENFFVFNYFNFENTKYIFGWTYLGIFKNSNLWFVCIYTLNNFLLFAEYEMAYEVLDNLISIYYIYDEVQARVYFRIAVIIYNYIKNREISELIEEWKTFEAAIHGDIKLSSTLYSFSYALFFSINRNDLVCYCSEKLKFVTKNISPELSLYDIASIGVMHNLNGNYELAIKCYKKIITIIDKKRNHSCLALWIIAWMQIIQCKRLCKKQVNTVKIVKNINKVVNSFENNHEFDEWLLQLNFYVGNLDTVIKIGWKLLKLYKKNKINLIFNEASLYLYIGMAYYFKFNLHKAHIFLCNAKACNGIQGKDHIQVTICLYLGFYYYGRQLYKDALYCFEYVYSCSNACLFFKGIKLYIGLTNYCMQNYEKALQDFIEAEQNLNLIPSNYVYRFSLYLKLGELYNLKKITERANYYYLKAVVYIKDCEKFVLVYEPSFDKAFSFFLKKRHFEKCKEILQIKRDYLKSAHLEKRIAFKSPLYIQLIKLCLAENKIEEANKYLYKVEKLLDIDKISLSDLLIENVYNIRLTKAAIKKNIKKCKKFSIKANKKLCELIPTSLLIGHRFDFEV